VLLWFAGLSFVLVWSVFRDPAIDYRLVMVGAMLPDVVDAPFGGPRIMHSVTASAVLLGAVMLATRKRRAARRRLLAVPIGTFMHLVLDFMWTQSHVFWWPFLGRAFTGHRLPSLDRPVAVVAVQELAGAAALVWCWRRFGLGEASRRAAFVHTGRLPRDPAPD
jgi:membrane-bound metal-dependent hydrolase YbcI (DUF457 family)